MLGASPIGVSPIGGWLELVYIEASNRCFEARGEAEVDSERGFEASGIFIFAKPLDYRIMVLDQDGNKVGQVTNYRSLTFGKRLSNYGQAEFDITVGHPYGSDLIDLRKNTIEIYRDEGTDRDLVWAGEQAVRRSNLDVKGNNWSEITCYTWFEQLFHRYTESFERYELEDAGDVIDGLISTTQGKTEGDFGITTGTIDTTYTADIIYQNDNIGESILGLADGGLDFEITDGKVLNVSSIIGSDKTNDVIIEYGHNVTNMTITEDFSQPVNQTLILGEVLGEDSLQRVERTDTALRSDYRLRQTRMNQLEPAILAIFEDKGDAAIRKFGMPLIKIDFDLIRNISPSIDEFTIGDGIRLIVKDGVYNIDEEYRVFEWQVTYNRDNTEKLSLILGKFTI
jgi:hypothetical protein